MNLLKPSCSFATRLSPRVDQCLILAAGNGRRLLPASGGSPKPLVQVRGRSLIEHVILDAHQGGIDRFVVVVGYGAEAMREWFACHPLDGVSVTLVENIEYQKDNGVSVLKAREHLADIFLLMMADHLFEARTARALLREPVMRGEVILAVDPNVDGVFDLDDATKVRREGDRIVEIGKQIPIYDALDTGMFLCTREMLDVLESAKRNGNCSLSDGMRILGRQGKLRAFDIGDAVWQDVDTPEALAYAESIYDLHFCPAPSQLRVTCV